MKKYWKPKLLENKPLTYLDDFNLFRNKIENLKENPYFDLIEKVENNPTSNPYDLLQSIRIKTVEKQLGISPTKIVFIRHEECHQFYGYYSQVNFKSKVLLFTIEGGGDDSSATLSIANKIILKKKYKQTQHRWEDFL